MSKYRQIRIGFVCVLIVQLLVMPAGGAAAAVPTSQGPKEQALDTLLWEDLSILAPAQVDRAPFPVQAAGPFQADVGVTAPVEPQATTLAVSIVSSPWGVLDHNNPGGSGEDTPQVFVVEAAVTNTGVEAATDLAVNLDYDEDPVNNWILLPGEEPDRTSDELGPGETYHAYWFARYSSGIGASHQYTVTASADNASPVSTSENAYGELDPGETVRTKSFLSTGNSGLIQTSASVVVGVAFTVTLGYDLGNNPRFLIFSPIGNVDFMPGAYRLVQSEVRLYNDAGTQESIVTDRLYFPTVPAFADNAEIIYTFIALTPSNTRICPYTAVGYTSSDKYDQFFCDEVRNAAVPIEGTATLSMSKQGSSVIQQGEWLTYTIDYANTGDLPLVYSWIWDDIEPSIGSILPISIDPPADLDETTGSRVAWYIGDITESGQPGSAGTLTFAIRVDGAGQHLADNTTWVNHASFGINQGSLPPLAAVTSTLATTIQAPTISLSKTSGQATAEPGEGIVYTLRVTNTGSAAATGLVITDVLPAGVNYTPGTASPPETGSSGQTLVWDNLGPIPPGGGEILLTIPVRVGLKVPDGTTLVDTMTVQYENPAGWVYDIETATDTITVNAPVLSIAKSGFPDPVLTGRLLTYTLDYANSGPGAATNVVITDTVPTNTTYQSCSGGSACGESSGIVSWTIGTLAGGSADNVRFSVLVSPDLSTGDTIRNQDYGIVADQTDFILGPLEITEVNRNAGFIEGYTFDDVNGNGVRDAGEVGLPGVTVSLPSATEPVQTTDGSGYYRFRVEFAGPIAITADPVAGYFQTTPGRAYLDNVLGATQTIHFGYARDSSRFGVIEGTVFEDVNHDGAQNTGENGLPGVTVTSVGAVNSPVTTNELGQYTLRYYNEGPVTVAETNPAFYISTTPDERQANVSFGSSGDSPIDFGDFEGISIAGHVFEDANTNGVNDAGESGIPGAIVTAGSASVTTGGSGAYVLYLALPDGTPISVTETDPTGYRSTNAIPGAGMSKVDNNALRIASPISGTVYSGDFGDVQASDVITVSGRVWNDVNADGQPDGEPYLGGAVIRLSSGMSQTTGSDGSFLLYGPAGEAITITETSPAGYASTNAIPGNDASKWDNDTLVVSPLSAGSTSTGNLFGDALLADVAVLSGVAFDDENEDGILDGGESGLPGITVVLETSDGDTNVVQTDSAGSYQFTVAPGTDARITSAGPGGSFYPTTSESVVVHLPRAGVFAGNDFGYSDDVSDGVAVIYGLVFDDVNGNGQQDFGELGLAGAVVTLDGSASVTTSGEGLITGTFTFSVAETGMHALAETNPSGYRSTTPDQVNVPVTLLGESYYVEFGDTRGPGGATIYGTVFDDLNGDGLQGAVEPGLAGVVISVTVGGGGGVLTAMTNAYGEYSFGLVGGTGLHTVSEQDPAKPGYRSTTPDKITLNIKLGNSYAVNFGDTLTTHSFSTITGIVFDDTNGDGAQDPAELGLSGVPVSLSSGMATTTDGYGGYTFAVTEIGPVQAIEIDPVGYHSTTPNVVTVTVAAMGQVYRVHFGDSDNAFVSSILGTVFDDLDASAAWDATEPALSGVTVTLTGPGDGLPGSYVTNEWGQYTFQIESTGTFAVTETDPSGYVSTVAIPGSAAVSAVDNNTLRVQIASLGTDFGDNMFGDVQDSRVITISGYVWSDANADGQPDGEPYLAGAVVSLSSGMAQTTGADGAFQLYAPAGQEITVMETNPGGYASTNAIPGNGAVKIDNDTLLVRSTLPAGQASTNNRFGDVQVCVVDVYEQDDRPQDARDLSSGARQEHSFCDDATDWLAITAQAGNIYTITTSSWGRRADTFLALYDRDASTQLLANDDYEGTTDYSSRIVWQALVSGVYYVRVTNRAGLTGSVTEYDVGMEIQEKHLVYLPTIARNHAPVAVSQIQPAGVIEHSCPDAYESDDIWQEAKAIKAGVAQVHSFDSDPAHYATDKDFVWFELWSGQAVTFTVTPVAGTLTLVELYDAQGTALNVSSAAPQLAWAAPTTGRYHLSVSPRTSSFGCSDQVGYNLSMEVEPNWVIHIPLLMRDFGP
jgi:uncharacterized repeat protein (TIGR01451 family)